MGYKAFSKFVFRTPFLSYNNLMTILFDKNTLLRQWSDLHIQDAIYIASPILYKELKKLFNGEIKEKDKINRLLFSFERYISRMTTRCTPFGLFAGCSVGNIGEITQIEMNDFFNRKTRLDMHYLCTLYDALLKIPEIKNKIKYYPNTSMYLIGKKYRYIECIPTNLRKKYQIAEIDHSKYLDRILSIAHKGSIRSDLIDLLTSEGVSVEEASDFIDKVIDSQLLIGELFQSVTGGDYFNQLVELVETLYHDSSLLLSLKEIQKLLKQIDLSDNAIKLYGEIIKNIKKIKIPYEENFLFQVDIVKNTTSAFLGHEIVEELKSAMTFLNKVTPSDKKELLTQFQKEFYNRYEEREVPLMIALDPELGIGYPPKSIKRSISPLIDDFYLPQRNSQNIINIPPFQSLLLKKIIDCLSKNNKEIVFLDDEIKDLPVRSDDLPFTLYIMFEVIRSNPGNVLLKLNYGGGSCGANLLTRFAHVDDEIKQLVSDITRKEEELTPNIVLAEITHLPEYRVGNILSRPHIRKHELVFMAYSDLPEDQLIYISDLMLSIREGQLVLRSMKSNKYILPRLTTAHNYSNNTLPVYHFLCDMQHQVTRNTLLFNWGDIENLFPFFPRVKYKQTIISPAIWKVKKEEIVHLFSIKDEDKLLIEVRKWRNKRSIPQYLLMADYDNKIFVDWEKSVSVFSLFSIIKKREFITFHEFLFDKDNAVVKKGNDVFLNECIVAFYKD